MVVGVGAAGRSERGGRAELVRRLQEYEQFKQAAEQGHVAVAEHLVAGEAEPSPTDGNCTRQYHLAARKGHVAIAEHWRREGA